MKLKNSDLLTSAFWFRRGVIKAGNNMMQPTSPYSLHIYVWLRQNGCKTSFQLNSEHKHPSDEASVRVRLTLTLTLFSK